MNPKYDVVHLLKTMMSCYYKCPYRLLVLCLRIYIKHDKNKTIKIQ